MHPLCLKILEITKGTLLRLLLGTTGVTPEKFGIFEKIDKKVAPGQQLVGPKSPPKGPTKIPKKGTNFGTGQAVMPENLGNNQGNLAKTTFGDNWGNP